MAVSYKNILSHVDKWEGGLVYIKTEGQWTNRGIQWTTFKSLAPSLLGISNPTVEDLKKLTQAQWEKFVEYFWNKATFNNSIKSQEAANLMFQALWGSGGYGIKEMQKALKVAADGVVGRITVGAINNNRKAAQVLYNALDSYYKRLAAQRPDKYQWALKGWLNRLRELEPGKIVSAGIIVLGAALLFYLINTK